ncbi:MULTISPECIES: hypothetical protein [Haloferax]|uniref:Uncharacterized protein n=1 Tax=Haloferax volcanii TaxID=2246 RepID=A0A558FYL6_HALVO|nr:MULTISPECIES: hypothetical protein [Haloferax]TVT90566.1 hypothetical protein FQA18_17980 [Haloferax volcanii]
MSEITHTTVRTEIDNGQQILIVHAEKSYIVEFKRPLGEDSPFTFTDSVIKPDDSSKNEHEEAIRNIKKELINQGYPVFAEDVGLKSLESGILKVNETEEILYSCQNTIEVSKDESSDPQVLVKNKDSGDIFEFVVRVDNGNLPPNWCLIDLVLMVNNDYLNESQPDIPYSDSVTFEISRN